MKNIIKEEKKLFMSVKKENKTIKLRKIVKKEGEIN